MESTHRVTKIIATPSDTAWVQSLVIDNFFVLLQVKTREESPLSDGEIATLGKKLLVSIEQAASQQKEKSLASLKKVATTFLESVPEGIVINFVLAQIEENLLYLSLFGKTRAFLIRNKQIGQILHSSANDIVVSSGVIQEGDIVALATDEFIKILSPSDLMSFFQNKSFFQNNTLDEASENIAPLIHGRDGASNAGAILILVKTGDMFRDEIPSQTKLEIFPLFVRKINSVFFLQKITSLHLAQMLYQKIISQKRRTTLFAVAALLFSFLIGAIMFGLAQHKKSAQEEVFQKVFARAQKQYEEGASLVDLNKELARKPLVDAKELLEKETGVSDADNKRKNELMGRINDVLALALKKYVGTPQLFFDTKLMRETIEPIALSFSDKTIAVLDGKDKSLYTIAILSKAYEVVAASLENPQLLALASEAAYVLDEKGITKIDRTSKKATNAIGRDEFGTIVALSAFGSNLYGLDTKSSGLWKFVPSDGEKMARKAYFPETAKLDFSAGISITIDGSVYVLFEDGTIRKYLEGRLDNFAPSGLDGPLKNPRQLFTDRTLDFLYVLDSGNHRVVVFKKNGVYEAQYGWEGLPDVISFAVSEEQKRIFLLSGTKIYSIDLK